MCENGSLFWEHSMNDKGAEGEETGGYDGDEIGHLRGRLTGCDKWLMSLRIESTISQIYV
jgi:hypothetical protein